MKNRTYNILFNLHTISGIVISAVLYIIFFAGSFSFFRDEIVNWERHDTVNYQEGIDLNVDKTLDSLHQIYNLHGRDVELKKYYVEQRVSVSMSASKDSLNTQTPATFFYIDTQDFSEYTYQNSYTLGEFLYRLHFLAQVYYPLGYYISGFVAFFFLFAIITGILVHWNKIVSNFHVFRPKAKLKTLWTDAHTGLGVLGLPFQFVYAVTGAFFMIKALMIAPTVMALYQGDESKFYEDLEYTHPHYDYSGNQLLETGSINDLVTKIQGSWQDFEVTEIHIFNYGDMNMHASISGHLNFNKKFNAPGEAIYNMETGALVHAKTPIKKASYLDAVKNVLYRIHYGDYGGYALRIVSFILGLMSCFVIISGVMIWLTARDKKNIPEKKRRFNEWLVRIYLAVCLSMYPITAAAFIAVKIVQPQDMSFIYSFYFIGWLLLSVFFVIKKDHYFTNKASLLWGSLIGLGIPIVNGFMTGEWIWISFSKQHTQLFFVDLFWICLSILTLWVSFKLKKKPATS